MSLATYAFQIPHLGSLLEEVDKTLRNALNSAAHQDRGALLHEACQINIVRFSLHRMGITEYLQLVFNAILKHRTDTANLYGLDQSAIPVQPWTSRPALIEGLQYLFEAAEHAIKDSSRDSGSTGDALATNRNVQNDLKACLCDLADFLLALYEERLQYLKGQDPSSAELRVMQERYISTRPRVIQALGKYRLVTEQICADVSHHSTHWPKQSCIRVGREARRFPHAGRTLPKSSIWLSS